MSKGSERQRERLRNKERHKMLSNQKKQAAAHLPVRDTHCNATFGK